MSPSLVEQLARQGSKPRRGVVGVIVEEGRFLVIRRSPHVRAPNLLCFAGGSIEHGESPEQAIVRELREELTLDITPVEKIWKSCTQWGTQLEWVLADRAPDSHPQANPAEVAEWMWMTGAELLAHPMLLPSVPAFFRSWAIGEFQLPARAGRPDPAWKSLVVPQ
ncbi:MAG: NUDIX hydrolase [Planctomycetota bacterium]|nr:MAG: NUDIX hydrolase [Planctomycetota bacterium]